MESARKRLQGREHVGGVPLHLHVREDFRDLPLFIDNERRPCHAPVGASHHRLLGPHAVLSGHGMVGVGQQRVRNPQFLLPLGVGLYAVGADAEDLRVEVLVRRVVITERGGLNGSPRRVIADVEPQHDPLPAEVRQAHLPAPIIR